jgi:aromatic-L-amino-acid decarboxylase
LDDTEFKTWAVRAAAWGADYRADLSNHPVRPNIDPGTVTNALPPAPPESPEPMEAIFADFERVIVPAMTHWQHPRFFAYFPANAAPPSVVAEILVSAVAAQCMLWQTSPAATELEGGVTDWLRQALGLPGTFTGVLQDSASTATLAAVLTMRERALGWAGNRQGLSGQPRLRVYASGETHTSVEKAVWISGIGAENLVRIPVGGPRRAMDPAALAAAIAADRAASYVPAGIIACVGGTSVGGTDDISAVAAVARAEDLFLHVDAAWAGSAMICPEFRHFWSGIEGADSLVMNPHKWLGAQFECAAHFVRDPESLVRTLAIRPDYLKTQGQAAVINYSEWSVPLGRRFRALKLWFLIRAYGLEGLRSLIRNHVAWAEALADAIAREPGFDLVTAPMLSLFSFRHRPPALNEQDLDDHNLALTDAINRDGRIYLTQTRVDGRVAIRFQAGSFAATEADVMSALGILRDIANAGQA